MDLVQIVVSDRQYVPEKDDGRDRCGGGDRPTDVLSEQ